MAKRYLIHVILEISNGHRVFDGITTNNGLLADNDCLLKGGHNGATSDEWGMVATIMHDIQLSVYKGLKLMRSPVNWESSKIDTVQLVLR